MEFETRLDDAVDPLVLAVDVGSTASRGALYDARGRPVDGRAKIPHAFTVAADGTSVIDADQVVGEVEQILDALARPRVRGRIAGVGLDTFASSLVGVAAGRAITPVFTYADSRCAPQLARLRADLDESAIQQRTGARLHTSYLLPRLVWLRETQPDIWARVDTWMSVGEYIHLRLLGTSAAGTAAAAWTGLLDRRTGQWDAGQLAVAEVPTERLGRIADPDDPLFDESGTVAARWPALAGVPFFAPVGDGVAANIGSGATDATRILTSAATSGAMRVLLPVTPETLGSGLWNYRLDRNRSLLGGALNDVGRAIAWAHGMFTTTQEWTDVLTAPPDPATPLVLPFFSGERSTGWAGSARAEFSQVSAATTPEQMVRGVVEGIVLAYRRIAGQLLAAAPDVDQVLLAGRVSADEPGLAPLLADGLRRPVTPVPMKRSTLHGTALLALETLAPGVRRAPPPFGATHEPAPETRTYWEDRAAAFEDLYRRVVAD